MSVKLIVPIEDIYPEEVYNNGMLSNLRQVADDAIAMLDREYFSEHGALSYVECTVVHTAGGFPNGHIVSVEFELLPEDKTPF